MPAAGVKLSLCCVSGKTYGTLLPLVAPGIHIYRRKENSKRAVHNDPQIRQVMRETKPRSEFEFVGVG